MWDAWSFFVGLWIGIGMILGALVLATRRMEQTHEWIPKTLIDENRRIEKAFNALDRSIEKIQSLSEKANKDE